MPTLKENRKRVNQMARIRQRALKRLSGRHSSEYMELLKEELKKEELNAPTGR